MRFNMRFFLFTVFSVLCLMLACNNSSEALDVNATATLTIFHSNDIMGYVKPCG